MSKEFDEAVEAARIKHEKTVIVKEKPVSQPVGRPRNPDGEERYCGVHRKMMLHRIHKNGISALTGEPYMRWRCVLCNREKAMVAWRKRKKP